jgi:glucokinase
VAVGIGFGGPVDRAQGAVSRSHQIEGWCGFPLRDWTAEMTHGAVHLDNDANMAALGEAKRGAGRNFNSVFYVTLGSGVGGGLVVDGRVYHGATPTEAEIGHVRLDRDGTLVEQRCSGWAVDASIRDLVSSGQPSLLAELARNSPGHEARHLADALRERDEAAVELLESVADDLAFALSHATHLMHPETIVLGGGLSQVGEPLRAAVAEKLPRYLMEVMGEGPKVQLSELGEDAVPTGCLLAAAEFSAHVRQ